MRIEARLNPDLPQEAEIPTKLRTKSNRFRLHCAECGELYYVDAETFRRATSALEEDRTEPAFCCNECIRERAEEEYAHSMC